MSHLRPSVFPFPPPAPFLPACLSSCVLACWFDSRSLRSFLFLFLSDSKRTKDGSVKLSEDQNGPSPSGSGKPWLAYRRIRIAERSRLTRTRGGRQARPPSGFAAALAALGFFHGLPILPLAWRASVAIGLSPAFGRGRSLTTCTHVSIYLYIYIYIYTYVRASIHTASSTIMLAFRRMHLCVCVGTHVASQRRSRLPLVGLPCSPGVLASHGCSRPSPDTWRHCCRGCSGSRR